MNHPTPVTLLISLFVSLTLATFVFGSLPLAAAGPLNAPVGLTETPTPTPTNMPVLTNTPTPTNMPVLTNTPTPTNTLVPVGLTETPTPTPTVMIAATETPTQTPTHTPVPANTSAPTATNTTVPAVPAATNTSIPAATATTVLAVTSTPTAPAVVGLPDTGGAAPQGGTSSWSLLWIAVVVGVLSTLAIGFGRRVQFPTRR